MGLQLPLSPSAFQRGCMRCSACAFVGSLNMNRSDSLALSLAFRVSTADRLDVLIACCRDSPFILHIRPSVSFSRPFDVTQHGAATYIGLSSPTVQRPRPFSGPRRVTPLHAYPPCFMRDRPWVLKSSERFPHRMPPVAHRYLLSSMLSLPRLTSSREPQLRGFEPPGESVPNTDVV
jgi:hypothetical protein